MKNDICAVIVSFNPEPTNLQRLTDQLLACGVSVCLVDNNSGNKEQISSIYPTSAAVKVFFLEENTGIAHAQNVGTQFALDHDYAYVVFFDQDSTINTVFITRLSILTVMADAQKLIRSIWSSLSQHR